MRRVASCHEQRGIGHVDSHVTLYLGGGGGGGEGGGGKGTEGIVMLQCTLYAYIHTVHTYKRHTS